MARYIWGMTTQPLLTLLPGLRYAAYAAAIDVTAAFRRNGLGTLWPSLGLWLLIGALGLFYGTVLRAQLPELEIYIPHLAAGLIAWSFIAGCLHRVAGKALPYVTQLRHARLPLAAATLRILLVQALILLQNLLLAALAAGLLLGQMPVAPLALLGGLLLLLANVLWLALLTHLLCTRFRDLPQMVAWVIHLAFFLTPVLWPAYFLGRYEWLAQLNPFTHLVELLRAPLLGADLPPQVWTGTLLLALAGNAAAALALRLLRHRLPYWN